MVDLHYFPKRFPPNNKSFSFDSEIWKFWGGQELYRIEGLEVWGNPDPGKSTNRSLTILERKRGNKVAMVPNVPHATRLRSYVKSNCVDGALTVTEIHFLLLCST